MKTPLIQITDVYTPPENKQNKIDMAKLELLNQ